MTRTDLLNFLIRLHGYYTYLEIGVQFADWNFNKIRCQQKEGVDPAFPATHSCTSDRFFETLDETRRYDIIFVDGLHEEGQVYKDVLNSLDHLHEGGRIVCHDMNPQTQEWENTAKNGTCWRAWARLRMTRPDLTMLTVDSDYGCGVLRRGGQVLFPLYEEFDYSLLQDHRRELLGLVSPQEFIRSEEILHERALSNC